jgi:hypothetical protein
MTAAGAAAPAPPWTPRNSTATPWLIPPLSDSLDPAGSTDKDVQGAPPPKPNRSSLLDGIGGQRKIQKKTKAKLNPSAIFADEPSCFQHID